MSSSQRMTRRKFLAAGAGALAAPLIVPSSYLGLQGAVPAPSERITMGVIGAGGMGRHNSGAFRVQEAAQVVAVCDVDRSHADEAAQEVNQHYGNKDCQRYSDFRELLSQRAIDAVVVATPDHWHALIAIAAVRARKDVYCEKPVTHTFAEGQALVRAVKDTGAVFQVGSQQRSDWNFRRAVELVLNGRIGKVVRVEVGLPTGHKAPSGDTKASDPPAGLDYEFWCGPSAKLAYVPARVHGNWRWHLSYGGGQLMDWIGHHNDISHWGLQRDKSGPVEVKAVNFQYPEDRSVWNAAWGYEIVCKYEDGVTSSISNSHPMGCKWIGESGWVHVDRGRLDASNPEWVKRETDPGPRKAYESNDHRTNFLGCVKSRKPTICPAETGHRSVTPGHLGLLSESLGGREIRWDAGAEKVVGDDEAQARLQRTDFRKPWSLDQLS